LLVAARKDYAPHNDKKPIKKVKQVRAKGSKKPKGGIKRQIE